MIITKQIYFEERPCTLTYSDKRLYIKESISGNLFSSAIDDILYPHEYIETDLAVESENLDGYFEELENM